MTETTPTSEQAPTPAPTGPTAPPPPPPPGPAQQAGVTSTGEATYTAAELSAEAAALGCYPWDVAGVFAMTGATEMTEADFKAALEQWRTPPPEPAAEDTEGGF